eukprot:gene18284-23962_t
MITNALVQEDWRIKVGGLNLLKTISPRVSKQITPLLPQIIPLVSECIYDSKRQVQLAGIETLNEACKVITNDDIRPIVPQLVSVIAKPDDTPKTLDLLLETTFVAQVDAPVLALIAPLLGKALRGRSSPIKRKASKVIDIMCRLVQDPADVAPFVPMLLPYLEKVIDEIVDAEVCEVAKAAREILLKAMGDGNVSANHNIYLDGKSKGLDINDIQNKLLTEFLQTIPFDSTNKPYSVIANYTASLCSHLVVYNDKPNVNIPEDISDENIWRYALSMTSHDEWKSCVLPYLTSLHGQVPDFIEETDPDGANLCNIEFSLAFGGKILLQNTHLRLGRGRRYGLMGKNGAGKTTLLTNIGSGNIEGLPSHLKTVYVQHDDSSDDNGVPMIDEMMNGKDMIDAQVTKEEAIKSLKDINFTESMLYSPRSSMSGGWKMKLLIIRAILSRANVLLLDEPTNHLDAASVQWLISYIRNDHDITCLIVSHDTHFLDSVVTDIIHYENKKLVYYHGNLTDFVRIHPEAQYYYQLDSSSLSFKFPAPERLEGINSVTRSVLRMENVSYTYPGASKPTITNVNVKVCLGSRIAITGANGAGKSTVIKLLVNETEPDPGSGEVWKHTGLRIAYVAQHSLHHVEQHLDKSPVDYIKWRFAGGVDREDMAKPTLKLTEEEVEEKKADKRYGAVDQIVGRRKNGRTMEYECTWIGQTAREPNKYIAIEKLHEMGIQKLVQQCDTRIAAAAAGLDLRPLLNEEIQRHLNDFNLDAEFGTHGLIRRLSGGQKVKLVLAAAMWNCPHIIVLDEPTNYLDREALGALTQAIKNFAGGVLIISHNQEFTDAICTEKWILKDGQCFTHGEVEDTGKPTSSSVKKSKSTSQFDEKPKDEGSGNTNTSISSEVLLNPRTLESLSKKEIRKLERLAIVAGVSLKEYVSKINSKSPEWKWL